MMSSQIRKIAIGGPVQVGKSTLVRKILDQAQLPIAGFMTKLNRNVVDESGMFPLYIYPAALPESEREDTPENLLGACAGRDRHKAYTARFDALATAMITDVPEGNIIVMDELGFLESEAENFKKKVFEVLDSDAYAVIVIKDRFDVPFLNELRALPQITYYRVDEGNRDALAEELGNIVSSWKTLSQHTMSQL